MRRTLAVVILLLPLNTNASNISSRSGASASVSSYAAGRFQCLVSWLDSVGYRIQFMGGWRAHGSVSHSKHPFGLALDINQTGRNRVTHSLPYGTTAAASNCGLLHGSVWHHPDTGHFEVY